MMAAAHSYKESKISICARVSWQDASRPISHVACHLGPSRTQEKQPSADAKKQNVTLICVTEPLGTLNTNVGGPANDLKTS